MAREKKSVGGYGDTILQGSQNTWNDPKILEGYYKAQARITELEKEAEGVDTRFESINKTLQETQSRLTAAQEEAALLRKEVEKLNDVSQVGILTKELDKFREITIKGVTEFNTYLKSVNLSDGRTDVADFNSWRAEILNGTKTVNSAIVEVSQKFRGLIETMNGTSGSGFDFKLLQQFLSGLENVSNRITDIERQISGIASGGGVAGGVAGGDAGSGGVGNVAEILREVEKAAENMTGDVKEAYTAITSLVSSLNSFVGADYTKLLGITNAFGNIAGIGKGRFSESSIDNIVKLVDTLNNLQTNGDLSTKFDFSGLNSLKLSADSVSSYKALAKYLPTIANANMDNLAKLQNINFSNLKEITFTKGAIGNISKLVEAVQVLKDWNAITLNSGNGHTEIDSLPPILDQVSDSAENAAQAMRNLANEEIDSHLKAVTFSVEDMVAALKMQGMSDAGARMVAQQMLDLEGKSVRVKVAWQDMGKAGERVAKVTVNAAGEVGESIQRQITYTHKLNAKTKEWEDSARAAGVAVIDYGKKAEAAAKQQTQASKDVERAAKEAEQAEAQQRKEVLQTAAAYKEANGVVGSITSVLASYSSAMQQAGMDTGVEYTQSVALAQALQGLIDEFLEGRITAQQLSTETKNISSAFSGYKNTLDQAKRTAQEHIKVEKEKEAALKRGQTVQDQAAKTQEKYSSAMNKMSAEARNAYNQISNIPGRISALNKELESGKITSQEYDERLKGIKDDLVKFSNTVENSVGHVSKLDAAMRQFGQYFQRYFSVYAIIRQFKQLVDTFIELDSKMTQLQVVTQQSSATMSEFGKTAAQIATDVGASMSDVIDSATTFARLGYTLDESSALAKYTTMLQNVGDIDTGAAQDAITAIMKAFSGEIDVSNIETVMDKLVTVGNNFPISVSQIAEGVTNMASALSASGNSFDQSIALLTAANTTAQNASRSSTGLRTIAARLRNVKTELDDLGEVMTEAKYEELLDLLTGHGVSITDEITGELRSTYDILANIASVWDDLDNKAQAAIATAVSGTRIQDIFYSIINQFKEAEDAMDAMTDSAGALESAYSTFMSSSEAHVNQFKAAYQDLAQTLIDKGVVNGVIDIGTALINMLTGVASLINSLGGLKTVLVAVVGIIATIKAQSIAKFITNLQVGLAKLIMNLSNFRTQFDKFRGSYDAYGNKISTFGAAMKAAGVDVDSLSYKIGALSTSITAAIAIINIFIQAEQKRKAALSQSADAATKAAEASSKEAEELYDLYITYDQARIAEANGVGSKKTLEEATYNLAKALGIEGDAAEDAAKKLTSLTIAELKSAQANAETAVNLASASLTDYISDKRGLSIGRDDILEASNLLYGTMMTSTGSQSVFAVENYYKSQSEQLEAMIQLYNDLLGLQSTYNDLIKAGKMEADDKDYLTVARALETLKPQYDAYTASLKQLNDIETHLNELNASRHKQFERIAQSAKATIAEMKDLADAYNALVNGNVDYNKRPFISPESMKAAGWNDFVGDIATTYTQGKTIGEGKYTYTLDITPILENGEVLSPEALNDYIDSLDVMHGIEGILSSDKWDLVVNVVQGDYDPDYWEPLEEELSDIKNQHYELAKASGVVSDEFAGAVKKYEPVVASIDSIHKSISALKSAYADLSDSDSTGVAYSNLMKLKDAFADVSDIDTYINKILEAGTDTEAISDIFSHLITEQINSADSSRDLANASEELVAAMLREVGVANSEEAAQQLVALAKLKNIDATYNSIPYISDFIKALEGEATASQFTAEELFSLALQEIATNNTNMTFEQQVAACAALAEAIGLDILQLQRLQTAMSGADLSVDIAADSKQRSRGAESAAFGSISDVVAEMDEAFKNLGANIPKVSLDLGTYADAADRAGGSSKDATEKVKEEKSAVDDLKASLSELKTAYDAINKAEEDMRAGGGLSVETIRALASGTSEYVQALYTENGEIKVNIELYKVLLAEGVNAHIDAVTKEIESLREVTNALIEERDALESNQYSNANAATRVAELNTKISENNALITEGQMQLMLYTMEINEMADSLDQYAFAQDGLSDVMSLAKSTVSTYKRITELQEDVADGYKMDLESALEYAEVFPQILMAAQTTADGEILLNQSVVEQAIGLKYTELQATIDNKIKELEAEKQVLIGKRTIAEANLKLFQAVANGEIKMTNETANAVMSAEAQAANMLIQAGYTEADAYAQVANFMLEATNGVGSVVIDLANALGVDIPQSAAAGAEAQSAAMVAVIDSLNAGVKGAHELATAIFYAYKGIVGGEEIDYSQFDMNTEAIVHSVENKFNAAKEAISANSVQIQQIIDQTVAEMTSIDMSIEALDAQMAILRALAGPPPTTTKKFKEAYEEDEKARDEAIQELKEDIEATENWFNTLYNIHQHLLAMSAETQEEYLTWLDEAYQKAADEGILSLDELFRYQEEVYKGYQNLFKEKLSNTEHQIEIRSNFEGESEKIVELYQIMIRDIEHEIRRYRERGFDDTNEYVQELQKKWVSYSDAVKDYQESITKNAKTALDELVDLRVKMLKEDVQNERDAIDERLELLQESYDRQKEMLRKERDEEEYIDKQAEKRKKVAMLRSQLTQLDLDNSAWAQKRKLELSEELADAQKDLDKFEKDHAVDMAEEQLKEMYDAQKKDFEDRKELLTEQLSDTGDLYAQALEEIKNGSVALYEEMVTWNELYGDGIEDTIKKAWEEAYKALYDYKTLYGTLYNGTEIADVTGSGRGSYENSVIGRAYEAPKGEARPVLEKDNLVTVKSDATRFSANSHNNLFLDDIAGHSFYIYDIDGDQLLLGTDGVAKGWVDKHDIVGYARGTRNAQRGIHRVNENGPETIFESGNGDRYRLFSGGEMVLTARQSQFLFDFAKNGADIFGGLTGSHTSSLYSSIGGRQNYNNINVGGVTITGNADAYTVSELRRVQRENLDYMLKELSRLNK